jgi:hypothetical protein
MHPVFLDDEGLLALCRVERTRGSGPGGQHRNKVATAVRLVHEPTGLVGQASERRSQAENLRVALRRLRLELALGVVGERPGDDPTLRPPSGAQPSASGEIPDASGPEADQRRLPGGAAGGLPGGLPGVWGRHVVKGKVAVRVDGPDFARVLAVALGVLAGAGWEPGVAGRRLGVSGSQVVKLLRAEPRALELVNRAREAAGLGRLR